MSNLIIAVVTPVVAYLVQFIFAKLGVAIDEATFNSVVGAIVSLFVGLFIKDKAVQKFPALL